MRCSELEETISRHETKAHQLQEEIGTLHDAINELTHELEAKGHEVLRVRSEANNMARSVEFQCLLYLVDQLTRHSTISCEI